MKSAILTIGTEILFGQIVNTNAAYLSSKLNDLGIDVMYHYTVGDNAGRLENMLDMILEECDLIVTTGGLGPTQDDLTKETVAKYMNDSLVLHKESMDKIELFFKRTNKEMTPNNIKQAYVPSRSKVLQNDFGSAPGFIVSKEKKHIICLPGPPSEMKPMFENYVIPILKEKTDDVILYKFIKTIGIGESLLETELMDLIDGQEDPTIATYAKEGEAYIRITSKRKKYEEAEKAIDDVVEKINLRISDYIYAYEDLSLTEIVVKILTEKNLTLSSAESCTGGLFADSFISIAGSSKYFKSAIVSYSNEAKVKLLGVNKDILDKNGAVSENVAIEMVKGLSNITESDICISVTGLCGPDAGDEKEPVGTVFIALKYKDDVKCEKYMFRNVGRNSMRRRCVLTMTKMIYDTIGDLYEK